MITYRITVELSSRTTVELSFATIDLCREYLNKYSPNSYKFDKVIADINSLYRIVATTDGITVFIDNFKDFELFSKYVDLIFKGEYPILSKSFI